MESVYLETSFISYLVSSPSRDAEVARRQQLTQQWWRNRRSEFRCCISEVVVDEISAGRRIDRGRRIAAVAGLEVLQSTVQVEVLAEQLFALGVFPARAFADAAHLAYSAVHGIEYFLTWNQKHLANPGIVRRVSKVCREAGYELASIRTPESLR